MKSFLFPLIEETHADLCSSMDKLLDALTFEIFSMKISQDYHPPNDLLYDVEVERKEDTMNSGEKCELKKGDLIAWSCQLFSEFIIDDTEAHSTNGMTWLRGETGVQGLHSVNYQNVGMFPWTRQRVDSTFVRNDLNQQYQAMLATGFPNIGGGDSLKQQFLQLQQPFHYLQHSGDQNPLLQQQQVMQPSIPSHNLQVPIQMLPETLPRPMQQQVNNQPEEHRQQHSYQDSFLIQRDQLQQRQQSDAPSPSFSKIDFTNPNAKLSTSFAPCVQNMLGLLSAEETGNILSFLRTGQSLPNEPSQHLLMSKFTHLQANTSTNSVSLPPYPGKDAGVEQKNCSLDAQNHAFFGPHNDSGLLLPTTLSTAGTSVNADVSSMPLEASGFQGSLYGCMQDSSEFTSWGRLDGHWTSLGSTVTMSCEKSWVGCLELKGLLEDPQRSGWQLVFVDRENDVLLLGDDPWEEFVNDVWYIKILSPEDVQKLGRQEVESLSHNAGERMQTSGSGVRDSVSGLTFVGSLEY
ncbi:auxin response factor 8 [Actinidia rufa]|uniref:Auxin response factor 8 n=1 Tax=Actinidia rufa TaxID=165716 RepID=A0A7J0DGT9_9ERIC|nr:auxin response factor 8 [Actinidia rufa]